MAASDAHPAEAQARAQLETLVPLALHTLKDTMESPDERIKPADRLRAAEAVMARVVPIMQQAHQGLTVHVHLSRAEREAIAVVAREIGTELPELPAPDDGRPEP